LGILTRFLREYKYPKYHQGFREQVSKWPRNPLDEIIAWIMAKYPQARVADFGCGDARLAASVKNKVCGGLLFLGVPGSSDVCDLIGSVGCHHQVYSFDLVANNERVTACNMAHVRKM